MPLKRVPYRSLRALLRRELITREDPGTAALIRRLAHVKAAGRFTRGEFLAMCRWKSPRSRLHYERSGPATIRRVSAAALAARDERARIAHLVELPGVSVATASAILTLIDPARYGVLDIRCWQLLFSIRSVAGNRRGRAFTLAQWEQYLTRLRGHARALGVSAPAGPGLRGGSGGADERDRYRRGLQEPLTQATAREAGQPAPSLGGQHDEIGVEGFRLDQDLLGRLPEANHRLGGHRSETRLHRLEIVPALCRDPLHLLIGERHHAARRAHPVLGYGVDLQEPDVPAAAPCQVRSQGRRGLCRFTAIQRNKNPLCHVHFLLLDRFLDAATRPRDSTFPCRDRAESLDRPPASQCAEGDSHARGCDGGSDRVDPGGGPPGLAGAAGPERVARARDARLRAVPRGPQAGRRVLRVGAGDAALALVAGSGGDVGARRLGVDAGGRVAGAAGPRAPRLRARGAAGRRGPGPRASAPSRRLTPACPAGSPSRTIPARGNPPCTSGWPRSSRTRARRRAIGTST